MAASRPPARLNRGTFEEKRMALKSADNPVSNAPLKPEEQELALKREEQTALETELAEPELRSANLRAELGAFERQYLHFVGARYAELDELKAQIAERIAQEQPENENLQVAAREARATSNESKSIAGEHTPGTPKAFQPSQKMKQLYREVARRIHPD